MNLENSTCDFSDNNLSYIVWNMAKYLGKKSITTTDEYIHSKINQILNWTLYLTHILKYVAISELLASIVYSYLKQPQYEREKIIYKNVVSVINKAIQNSQTIRIKKKSKKQ